MGPIQSATMQLRRSVSFFVCIKRASNHSVLASGIHPTIEWMETFEWEMETEEAKTKSIRKGLSTSSQCWKEWSPSNTFSSISGKPGLDTNNEGRGCCNGKAKGKTKLLTLDSVCFQRDWLVSKESSPWAFSWRMFPPKFPMKESTHSQNRCWVYTNSRNSTWASRIIPTVHCFEQLQWSWDLFWVVQRQQCSSDW